MTGFLFPDDRFILNGGENPTVPEMFHALLTGNRHLNVYTLKRDYVRILEVSENPGNIINVYKLISYCSER